MERALNSKVGVAAIIVGSIFLLTAGAAFAAGTAKGEAVELRTPNAGPTTATLVSTDTISYTQHMTGGVMIPTCIGLFFGVEMTDVVTMRSEEQLGWGEVAKIYFFATESMTDVNYILELRTGSKMGYGQIAKLLDLSPGRHGQNLGCIVSGRCAPTDTVPISGTVTAGAQRLADRLGADAEDIAGMLEQGASNGTVIVAHKLAAQFPNETPEELVRRRLNGEKWGEIRRSLKDSTSTTTSGLSTPGGGKSKGNQGHHGKPENKGNQGRALGHGKGGGKKH
ncbi:MAG: hypothetical protein GTO63_22500 [Anaerolineae bacterium]|nr:hypothetical protein [Anaerolineae bacterium]NIN97552.1 hypothetical protein [Anaerolineae bacterium]NIQ80480.1 hypothetical protein [Anaerolineae bacterium]